MSRKRKHPRVKKQYVRRTTVERQSAIKSSVGRVILIVLLLIMQISFFIYVLMGLYSRYPTILIASHFLSIAVVLAINAHDKVSAMKLAWVIVILAIPLAGVLFYLFFQLSSLNKVYARSLIRTNSKIFSTVKQSPAVIDRMKLQDTWVSSQLRYLNDYAGYPVYSGTKVKYFSRADIGIRSQIEDLKKAQRFIFMEYHAIENKESFEPILDVLIDRAQNGVDVRIIYDDIGSFVFVNSGFKKMLESYGIKCRIFNPLVPMLQIFMNHRDHRKITVIDNMIGYTGGYNIANEYFNITHPYGYWKDTGLRLEGPAVVNLTAMFLEMWEFSDIKAKPDDPGVFLDPRPKPMDVTGYICPFADSPIDDETVGENVYINILNNSVRYCYFSTPYLVISDELKSALTLAAKRGVDVRIITPGIPDKKTVYSVTRSYYNQLIAGGVRIYEYTPGFNHAKMCISDTKMAVVGTINLDFRSLYHHFENACLMFNEECIKDIKSDFDSMFAECRDVTEKYREQPNVILRTGKSILRLIAPML